MRLAAPGGPCRADDRLSIAHLDCDAFYATVEKRDRPEVRDEPVIVGGGKRGVVTTCCYIARTYGVRSAMPMFKALRLCPHAVVIKPDFAKYSAESRRIMAMLQTLTPLVQPLSLDEAWLDLSGTERLNGGSPATVLARTQSRIEAETGLTLSVGLAANKFLAKIASDLDKPRGFSVIGAEAKAFLADRSVAILPGVGPAFVAILAEGGAEHRGRGRRRRSQDVGAAVRRLWPAHRPSQPGARTRGKSIRIRSARASPPRPPSTRITPSLRTWRTACGRCAKRCFARPAR